MAPRSSTTPPKLIHLHILYTVSPATQTHFVRSRARVQVKQHAQLKGCPEKWASCPVGEVVKAMLGKSPDLMPNSREDHSLHFNSPRDTYREALYSSGADNPPIEVQMGLVGWALDDTSEESRAMVMGVLRKDEIEAEGSDDEDDDAEEWLEVRLRLAKAKPISHAQHLIMIDHLQRGETPPPLPAPPPPVAASPVTRSMSSHHNASASSSMLTPFPAPSTGRATKTAAAAASSSRAKTKAEATPAADAPPKRPRGRPKGSVATAKTKKAQETAAAAAAAAKAAAKAPRSSASSSSAHPPPPPAASAAPQPPAPAGQAQPTGTSPSQDMLLAALSQNSHNFTTVTPELLDLIKRIGSDTSADAETGQLVRSILDAVGAGGSTTVGGQNQHQQLLALGASTSATTPGASLQLPTPAASAPPTASGSGSGEMGPPALNRSSSGPQDDAASRLRRLSAGKGKELAAGAGAGSDAPMPDATSSASKKRKTRSTDKEDGCENCGATKSFAWRRKSGSGKVCNACGIYWNRYKSKRPRELWGEPEPPLDDKEHEKDKRLLRSARSSVSMASSSAATPAEPAPHPHQQMLPTLPPSPYNLRTSPARIDAARRAQAFLPMTSPLRAGKVSLLPLTSPVRAIKRSAAGGGGGLYESPRTALKKMLNGGSQITLSRLHKPLSDDGVRDMTLTPGSDSRMKSSSIARGLPATGSSAGLGDEDMDLGLDAGTPADDSWMHSDFSSFFSFNEDDDDELMNASNTDTPRTNRTVDSSVMGSSPFLAPFDFSTLPPSSPPTVSADLLSSPDTQRDFNSPLPPLGGGDDPSPAPTGSAAQAHAGHLDLESIKAMFTSNSPASTSSATTIPTSTGFPPAHHDGAAVASADQQAGAAEGAPPTKAEQLEFLRLWELCQATTTTGRTGADGQTPGSDPGGGSGVTPPTWVTE